VQMAGHLHLTYRQYLALEAGELEIDNELFERIVEVCGWPRVLVTGTVATAIRRLGGRGGRTICPRLVHGDRVGDRVFVRHRRSDGLRGWDSNPQPTD
jgi:hypothetical protein